MTEEKEINPLEVTEDLPADTDPGEVPPGTTTEEGENEGESSAPSASADTHSDAASADTESDGLTDTEE